jgi:acetoacetate decarboxylase
MTRTFGLDSFADPGLKAGAAFGGTLAANDRRLAEGSVVLEGLSERGPTHNDPPLVNVRHFPQLAATKHETPAVHELVEARSRDRSISPIWEGSARLELLAAPNEEHDALRPVKMGRGFRFTFAYTVDDLGTGRDLRLPEG